MSVSEKYVEKSTTGNESLFERAEERPSTLPGKKISFSKRVKIKKIRSHKLFSEEEKRSIWHSPEEYAAIRSRCVKTIKKMMKSNFQEDDETCPRGLEVRLRETSSARKDLRRLASSMVFDEQENQEEWGMQNVERIREAYLDISIDAHERAHAIALNDQGEVQEYIAQWMSHSSLEDINLTSFLEEL